MSKTGAYSDAAFWQVQWDKSNLFWHRDQCHLKLKKHLDVLTGGQPNRLILFPLCGKAVDMAWLASQGHRVVGVEVTKEACEQFFAEQNMTPVITKIDGFTVYSSQDGRVKIYQGDFFAFTSTYEGKFDAVWDRGALVAIPYEMRVPYVPVIVKLMAPGCNYLLNTFDYDSEKFSGPPHLVTLGEIKQHYGETCSIEMIDKDDTKPADNFKDKDGLYSLVEVVYLIKLL